MNYRESLGKQFNDRLRVVDKRPGIVQLFAPLYHEDGDIVDIFLEQSSEQSDRIRICDHGMTLMRLSYSYDLNTPKKNEIFHQILSENGVNETEGNIFIDTEPDELYPAILQFAQIVAKVSSMRMYRREVVRTMFFEMLDEVVQTKLSRFNPQKSYFPLPEQKAYEVDYCFNSRKRPLFLFGVNSPDRSKLATISCLKFQTEKQKFYGAVVLENLDVLGKKDEVRLLSASDKVFPSLDDLRENGERFLERGNT